MKKLIIPAIFIFFFISIEKAAWANSMIFYFPDNGHYYQRFDIFLSWPNAKKYSEEKHGYLATLTSAAEDSFVYSHMGIDHVNHWLGASDLKTKGVYEWITGEPWSYSNWDTNQPDNNLGGQDCLTYWDVVPSKWDDQEINNTWSFITEWNSNPVPEPATILLLGSGLIGLLGLNKKK